MEYKYTNQQEISKNAYQLLQWSSWGRGGVCWWVSAGGCLPGGEGVCQGVAVPARGWGCLLKGRGLPRGECLPREGVHLPPVNIIADRCKNITFLQLRLRTVNMFGIVSVWNLVTIAAERYLAVCQPFKHNNFTRGRVLIIFGLIYVLACPLCTGAAFQVRLYQIHYYLYFLTFFRHMSIFGVTYTPFSDFW